MARVRLWGCDAHLLPGRLRLTLPGLLGDPWFARRLEQRLGRIQGVRRVGANPDTGRVLLLFEPGILDVRELRAHLDMRRPAPPVPPSRRAALGQALIPGAALAVVAAKRWALGPSALSQSWVTYDLAGVVTAVASYPFLRRGLAGVCERRRISGDLLIGVAGLTMALLRENVVALGALFLAGLNNLVLSKALEAAPRSEPHDRGTSRAAAKLVDGATKQAARWGAIAVGAAVITAMVTGSARRALAALIAAAPATSAAAASLPLSISLTRCATCASPQHLKRQTVRTIKQNMWLQTGLNAVGLALALTGAIGPLAASLWHNLTTVFIQCNSMKLLRHPQERPV